MKYLLKLLTFILWVICGVTCVWANDHYCRLASAPGTTYTSLQSAYNAASTGDTIQAQTGWFQENLTLNRSVNLTIEGGYNSNFTSSTGNAAIVVGSGNLTMGHVTMDNIFFSGSDNNNIFTSPSEIAIADAQSNTTLYSDAPAVFTVNLSSGGTGAEYCFWVDNTLVQNWSSQNTCNWSPTGPGEHTLKVGVRTILGQDTMAVSFYVFRKPVVHPN